MQYLHQRWYIQDNSHLQKVVLLVVLAIIWNVSATKSGDFRLRDFRLGVHRLYSKEVLDQGIEKNQV